MKYVGVCQKIRGLIFFFLLPFEARAGYIIYMLGADKVY